MNANIRRSATFATLAVTLAFGSAMGLAACVAAPSDVDSEELLAAAEDVGTTEDSISGSIAVGTELKSTANVNLRTGPSTSYKVLHVVPNGSKVTVVESTPQNGFYKIKHDGTVGWSYGKYYQVASTGGTSGGGTSGGGTTSSSVRDAAITRAKSGVGFSYWWGHGRFRPEGPTSSNKGSCSGSCPNCSHSGSYGGDCSGFAAKVWQVPGSNSTLSTDSHPYSTYNFNKDSSQWSTVSRGSMQKGDAMVYNVNGAGHIFIYEKGDAWGTMYSYECKGCSYGCVYGSRTASSSYHAIRRAGW